VVVGKRLVIVRKEFIMEKTKVLEIIDDRIMVARSRAIQAEDRKKFSKMLEWEAVMGSLIQLKRTLEKV
jgi:hypothetical protein